MTTESPLLLALDLTGTFAFAVNGALTAIKVAKLDVVGVITLGMMTALGGGIIRDILIGSLPPATFSDWRYLLVAAAGSLLAFGFGSYLSRSPLPDPAAGRGRSEPVRRDRCRKSIEVGVGVGQAVILGAVTAVGGGTIRDVMIGRVPVVLRSELYAIPALCAAAIVVVTDRAGVYGVASAVGAALICFSIRMLGVRYRLNAPRPPRPPGTTHD